MEPNNSKSLELSQAEINYIYSCIPSRNDHIISFYDLFGKNADENSFIINDKDEFIYKRIRPTYREGVSHFLDLNLNMGYLELPIIENCELELNKLKYKDVENKSFKRFINYKDKLPILENKIYFKIYPLLRIFSTGTSCTIRILAETTDGQFIDSTQVHQLLHCVGLTKNRPPIYLIKTKMKPFCYNEKNMLLQDDNYIFSIYGLFGAIITEIIENHWSIQLGSKISLLCRENLFHVNNDSIYLSNEAQTPWIVSNLKITGQTLDDFTKTNVSDNSSTPSIKNIYKNYSQELAPLLFRTPDLNMTDMIFEDTSLNFWEHKNTNLSTNSLYFDSRLFLQISRRSILTLSADFSTYPAKHLLAGLMDISELLRTRWQTLVILNLMFDNKLDEYYNLDYKTVKPISELIIFLNQVVKCLESPSLFVVSDDCLREIHEYLNNTFNITILIKVALRKAEIYEKLHRAKLELDWIEDSEKYINDERI